MDNPLPAPIKSAFNVSFLLKLAAGIFVLTIIFQIIGLFVPVVAGIYFQPVAAFKAFFGKKNP